MLFKNLKAALGWKAYKNITPLPPSLQDQFFVLFSIPKSGSHTLTATLSTLLHPGRPRQKIPPALRFPSGLDRLMPLHRDLGRIFPRGGYYATHAEASFPTLEVLHVTGAKYLIMVRHPLDQLVANYCHLAKYIGQAKTVPAHPEFFYAIPQAVYRRKFFLPGVPPDEGLAHLIEEGALEASLRWMADWAALRDAEQSHLCRFEDLLLEPGRTVDELCHFLRPGYSVGRAPAAHAFAQASKDYKSHTLSVNAATAYPRGWSGEIGIWKKYLSAENLAKYREVTGKFMLTHQFAGALELLYPDWDVAEVLDEAPHLRRVR